MVEIVRVALRVPSAATNVDPDPLERLVPAHGEDDRVAVLVAGRAAQTFSYGSAAVMAAGGAEALGERGGGVSQPVRTLPPNAPWAVGFDRFASERVVGALHAAEAVAGAERGESERRRREGERLVHRL